MNKRKHPRRRDLIGLILDPLNLNGIPQKSALAILLLLNVLGLLDSLTPSVSNMFLTLPVLVSVCAVGASMLIASVARDILDSSRQPRIRTRTKKQLQPSLAGLFCFADWWGLDLRKRIKALAGDYDAEIRRLCGEDRYLTARWNKVLAWTFALWYIGRGPWDWIRALLLLAVKGK